MSTAPVKAPSADRSAAFVLETFEGRLQLRALHRPRMRPIFADWHGAETRRRVAAGKRQLLGRAVGLHQYPATRLLDATAGLGRDAYVLACLGAEVTMLERCAQAQALLADALRRLQDQAVAARLRLVKADAIDWLRQHPQAADVVLLDPMYPEDGKTALARKEMQLLRELTGGDGDADALLPAALRCARRRVVVKRAVKARELAGLMPDYRLQGTQARYDVYLPERSDPSP